jgi:hypothetical protein
MYDFPVKAYLVGKAKTIWTYKPCLAPEFGITSTSYEKLFTSTGANLGIITRLHLDVDSCNNEHFNQISNLVGVENTSSRNGYEKLVKATYIAENSSIFNPSIMDLTAASSSNIIPKAWETS